MFAVQVHCDVSFFPSLNTALLSILTGECILVRVVFEMVDQLVLQVFDKNVFLQFPPSLALLPTGGTCKASRGHSDRLFLESLLASV